MMGMHSIYWDGMGGWMFFWWIFIVLIIVGPFIFFIRQARGNNEKSALDILKERYAKGEISNEEFEEKKRVIQ